jgi:hypothetical protein
MQEETWLKYKNYQIYLNRWDEYCICDLTGKLLAHDSTRKTLEEAKQFIDKL